MKVFIDYDSTLVDILSPWLDWCNAQYLTLYNLSHIDNWYWFNNTFPNPFGFFDTCYQDDRLQPIKGSQEFFKWVGDRYPTVILTSTHKNVQPGKNEHIRRHFGTSSVIHEHDKYKWSGEGCVLIDDRDWNIVQWVLAGGVGILFGKNSYNEDNIVQHERIFICESYEEVKRVLREQELT